MYDITTKIKICINSYSNKIIMGYTNYKITNRYSYFDKNYYLCAIGALAQLDLNFRGANEV